MAAGKRRSIEGCPGLRARMRADGTEVFEFSVDKKDPVTGEREQRMMPVEATTEEEARAWWGKLTLDDKDGKVVVPKGDLRLKDLWAEVKERIELRVAYGEFSARTLDTYQRDFDNHVLPVLGNALVAKLTEVDMTKVLDERKAKKGQGKEKNAANFSVNSTLTVLRRLSRHAFERRYTAENICDRVSKDDRPSQVPRKSYMHHKRVLRDLELGVLLDYMRVHEPWYVGITTCLAYTGMRNSEARGLRWGCIDWDNSRILLEAQLGEMERGKIPTELVKRKEDRGGVGKREFRSIPIWPRLREELLLQRDRELDKGLDPRPEAFCFTAMAVFGRPFDRSLVSRVIARSGEAVAIGRVVPRDLRRTAATMLAHAGVDRYKATQILGHSPEVYDADYAMAYADAKEQAEVEALLAKAGMFGLVEVAA